jgi:hypothetical protein
MDYFIGWAPSALFLVGYGLFVICFFCKDILYLRALAVIGQIALIPYYVALFDNVNLDFAAGHDLISGRLSPYIGLFCSVILVSVNLVYICLLLTERRSVLLTPIEKTVYELSFSSLTSRTFKRLFRLGKITNLKQRDLIICRNSKSTMLYLILDGSAEVELSSGQTKELNSGHFIGELSFITGDLTSANVRASQDNTTVLAWTKCDLVKFLDRDLVLSNAFDLILSTDVTGKLKRMNLPNIYT